MQRLYAQMFARGLSARTIEYTNAVLESAFRQAVRWKVLAEDPCAGVDLPRVKRKEMEALSVEECRRFLSVAEGSEWYALFALALTTGMRPSEYLALKWSDIDWQRGAASVSRTIQESGTVWAFDDTKRKRSRRVVKLQGFVMDALRSLIEERTAVGKGNCCSTNELIFVTGSGMPLRQRVVKREFRRLLAKAGIRSVRLYDLRHTAATLGIADVGGINSRSHRGSLENRRDRIAMQACGGHFVMTIDSAKDCARGNFGGGKPLANCLYWASLFVLAERDRDFFTGLLLVGFRTG
jgi:integrase